ncbi:MAG: hypothetical protein AAFV95_12810 [Bacteroidota bacterium]
MSKWVRSPAHNQRQDVVQMCEYLSEERHLYKDEFLAKEVVFAKLWPQDSFDDARMRQSIHFFNKALEEFLIYNEVRQDSIFTKTALARVFRKRRLNKPFEKNLKQIHSLQEKYPFRNAHYLRNEYLIQAERYTYLSGFRKRTTDFNLQETSDALDTTFMADKLRQACLILSHQNVYQTHYKVGLLDEVLSYIESDSITDEPAITIYYYTYKALTEKNNPDHFHSLKEAIISQGSKFPKAEIRDIYLLAINYCIGQINAGNKAFIRETFDLYREGIEKKILADEKNISGWTFQNAILNALMLKEFEWVENFINQYQDLLDTNFRDAVVNYSLARLYYEKEDYDKSMGYITQTEFNDILINLNAKTLLLKIFYEQQELNVLESLLESMRNYIVRKKVMGYHKSNFKNIIRYTRKLVKVNPFNKAHVNKLKEEISTANPLSEREWLLRQLNVI